MSRRAQSIAENLTVASTEGLRTRDVAARREEDPDATGVLQPGAQSRASRRALSQGAMIGRFLVLDKLGEGGMGVVYAAYDPSLNRRVALKLLLVEGADHDGDDARSRLVREAQALAALSHPSVVAVYEVGEHEGDVFIAMEYVEGETLRDWLKHEQRAWREVLAVCIEAGRGLAAAHAAGLVHRDFKPANVLVGTDGRVRVMDFGLARASSADATEGGPAARSSSSANVAEELSDAQLHANVTRYGVVVGTPAYMAPEQLRGVEADARSDQYSYCVSLFEALYGQKPSRENAAGTPVPRGTAVPPWVHRVIARGLQAAPAERFASMDALLQALLADPSARRKKVLGITGAALLLPATAFGAAAWQQQQKSLCQGAQDKLTGVWDLDRSAKVEAAFLSTGVSYAPGVWEYVRPKLDAYAREWAQQHTDACEATSVRGEQSAEVLDLRMACLQRARIKLNAAADVLQSVDAAAVQKAHQIADGLDSLTFCADVEALRAEVKPPAPHEARAVETVRAHLAQASALRAAGRYPEAKAALQAAEAAMATVAYGPLRAEVSLENGGLLSKMGEYEASQAALRVALGSGARWKQWKEVQSAATNLLGVLAYLQARPEEGLRYLQLARGLSAARGDEATTANLHTNLGGTLFRQDKHSEAEEEFRRALMLRQKTLGPEHPDVASAHNNLGASLVFQGKHRQAEEEYRRALVLWRKALGPEHPDVAYAHYNLSEALIRQGKHREAEEEARQALVLWQKALGPEHPVVAGAHNNLGSALNGQGKHKEAEEELQRALPLTRKVLGPEHPHVALAHYNLGSAFHAQGKHSEAEAEHRRALALWQKALGPEHPKAALAHDGLGLVFDAQGKHTEAEAEYRRAISLREKALGAEHPLLAVSRVRLASVLLTIRRSAEALPLAEAAWEVLQEAKGSVQHGEAAFVLARAVLEVRSDRVRAGALASRASQTFAAAGSRKLEEVRTWLKRVGLAS